MKWGSVDDGLKICRLCVCVRACVGKAGQDSWKELLVEGGGGSSSIQQAVWSSSAPRHCLPSLHPLITNGTKICVLLKAIRVGREKREEGNNSRKYMQYRLPPYINTDIHTHIERNSDALWLVCSPCIQIQFPLECLCILIFPFLSCASAL